MQTTLRSGAAAVMTGAASMSCLAVTLVLGLLVDTLERTAARRVALERAVAAPPYGSAR